MLDPINPKTNDDNTPRKSVSLDRGELQGREVTDISQQDKDAAAMCFGGCLALLGCNPCAALSFWFLACSSCCSSEDDNE